ncbi:MAG: 23S rRNA (adenine(2503)-C(2))-methyltransferase RlmN [Opitutaceae bacterium]
MSGSGAISRTANDRPNPSGSDSRDLLDWTQVQLESFLLKAGHKPIHAETIRAMLFRRLVTDTGEMDGLPGRILRSLKDADLFVGRPAIIRDEASSDGFTRKFLLQYPDGEAVETVLMRYRGRSTACVSTQAGCAMGCVFCATGQAGFRRQLTTGEILAQILLVARVLRADGERLRNLVLMGQGEPLHNYDAVMQVVDEVIQEKGLALAADRVTLSTVGLVPGIRRLADEGRPMSLAVSLHAATDEERRALIPVARRWPLAELMDACRYFTRSTGREIFFEWTLIEGVNDGPDQAAKLVDLLRRQSAHVNLIPLNPTAGFTGSPTGLVRARRFQEVLRSGGIVSTIRQRRGIDIAAGCGQLAASAS